MNYFEGLLNVYWNGSYYIKFLFYMPFIQANVAIDKFKIDVMFNILLSANKIIPCLVSLLEALQNTSKHSLRFFMSFLKIIFSCTNYFLCNLYAAP